MFIFLKIGTIYFLLEASVATFPRGFFEGFDPVTTQDLFQDK